jgi:NAD(P)-dependent dehydrogenase (short-subunit alcohol dehydrogenase family)
MREQVVLITGAGGGLGKALVREYLVNGWYVIACDVNMDSMVEFSTEAKACPIFVDVTSDESVEAASLAVKKMDVVIDLIINNAGIDRYFPLSEAPPHMFRQVFEVNVFGASRINSFFLPLLKRPGGRIIHIGSESLNLTLPFMTYPLSKKLLEGYSGVLRQELKFSGIDVVTIRPGAIETPLLDGVINMARGSVKWQLQVPFGKFAEGAVKEIGKRISPEKAAGFIYSVSLKPNPLAVYRIHNRLLLRIAALLPFRVMEWMVGKKLS